MQRIRVAILGTSFGRLVQAPGFQRHPGFELVAIAGRDAARTQHIASELGVPKGYGDWRELLERERPELVSIVTPVDLHHDMMLAALAAGAHVHCEKPTALHNNCSGKHAGLLLACRALGLSHADYTDPGHALQRRIRALVARYADIPESWITVAVDGCNLPVFRLPLSALAGAYARLVAGRLPGEEPCAAAVRARIVRALTKQPDLVAGTGRFTTDFIQAGRGRWIGKEGAEGVYAVGLRAAARGGKAIGIAFKIEDGSARPRDAVTLAALDRLGALPLGARRALASYAQPPVQNALGLEVGRIEVEVPIARRGRRGAASRGARQAKR
jgi:L-asparaginase II